MDSKNELMRLPVSERCYATVQAVETVCEHMECTDIDLYEKDENLALAVAEDLEALHNDHAGSQRYMQEVAWQTLRALGMDELETVLRRFAGDLERSGG